MTKHSCCQVRVRPCRSIRAGEGHLSALGRAGVFRDTGCFRGQVESRVLVSGDLLGLEWGGQGQLRAESGVGLWNQVPLIHFWQTPGHRARPNRASQTLLAPEEPWA